MAFPQVVQSQQYSAVTTNAREVSVALPAGIVTGNLMLLAIAGLDDTADAHPYTLPSDWYQVAFQDRFKDSIAVFGKIATATDSSSTVVISANSPIDETLFANFIEISGFNATLEDIEFSSNNGGTLATQQNVYPLNFQGTPTDILWLALWAGPSSTPATVTLSDFNTIPTAPSNAFGFFHIGYTESSLTEAPSGTYTSDVAVSPIRITMAIPAVGSPKMPTAELDVDVAQPGQTLVFTYQYFTGDPTAGPVKVSYNRIVHTSEDINLNPDAYLYGLSWDADAVDSNGQHYGGGSVRLRSMPSHGNVVNGLPFKPGIKLIIDDPGV